MCGSIFIEQLGAFFSLLVFGDDLGDPREELGDPGVDPGVVPLGTPDAPGHYAQLLATGVAASVEGSTAVTLKQTSYSLGKIMSRAVMFTEHESLSGFSWLAQTMDLMIPPGAWLP